MEVKLNVYDISGGLARELSGSLLGRQIDGVWNVSGTLEYAEGVWSLDPLLISPDGNITSVFDRSELFRGQAKHIPSARRVKLFQILSQGFSFFLAGLTSFWIMWLGRDLLQRNIPLWPLICFSALSLLLCLLAKPILDAVVVGRGVNLGGAPLGLAFLCSGCGLLAAVGYWSSMKRVMQGNITVLVFLLFGPALFVFYIVQWWSGIDRVADWSFGDDWSRYQLFAFRIVFLYQMSMH